LFHAKDDPSLTTAGAWCQQNNARKIHQPDRTFWVLWLV
jgi:hypothetical protein